MTRPLAVDLVGLVAAGPSGVPRYARSLSRALDRVAAEFPDLSLRLIATPAIISAIDPRTIQARAVMPLNRRFDMGPVRLAVEQLAAATGRGLLHFFDLSGPVLAPRRPFTTTVHDAVVTRGYRGGLTFAYKRRLCPWAARRARALVADTTFSRDEAVSRFGAPPRRVVVIPPGPGLMEVDGPPRMAMREAPFLLSVGNLVENKNLPFLVRAFGRANVDAELLLVGRPGSRVADLRRAIAASPRANRIHVVTDATDADVDALYRSARALLLPSRYEGFGFTPLEAMTRGCPVIASDIPAVREVCGDGAWLLPPTDEPGWARAIAEVAREDRLRARMIDRGSRVAGRYSWDATARALCALFLRAGAGA